MATFTCRFGLGDRVYIDGDDTIVAVITQVCWGDFGSNVLVSWWSNGDLKSAWVADHRLTEVPSHLALYRLEQDRQGLTLKAEP